MNIVSLLLAMAALIVFALAYQGHKYATIAVGLALVTSAWMLQLLWVTDQITL